MTWTGPRQPPGRSPTRTGRHGRWPTPALIVAIVALVVGAAGLREAHKKTTKTEPTKTTTTVPGQIEVPDVVGKNAIDASVALKAKKLTSKVVKTKSATVKKGVVISQKPAAGAKVAQNASVELTVSDGP